MPIEFYLSTQTPTYYEFRSVFTHPTAIDVRESPGASTMTFVRWAASRPEQEIERRFIALAEKWNRETAHLSSYNRIVEHPAYVAIIAMGAQAIPLIIKQLRSEGGEWFLALATMAGEDPAAGLQNRHDAAQAWVDWGTRRGMV